MALLAQTIAAPVRGEEWISLFNGRDLEGWKPVGGAAEFRVEDGVIVGVSRPSALNSFLVTEKSYGDFVLELEFQIAERTNSGVQVRSASRQSESGDVVFGYQVEIDPSERAWTGGIYDESRRGWLYPLTVNEKARGAFVQGEWNRLRVECRGLNLRTWVNGVAAADVLDDTDAQGFIALQVHAPIPGAFERGAEVRFRSLRLQPIASEQRAPDSESDLTSAKAPYVVNLRPNDLSVRESELGWRRLFDGRSLEGWRGIHQKPGDTSGWIVEGGELRFPGQGTDSRDLVTEEVFEAFELQLEVRFEAGGNSGIKYGVVEQAGSDTRHGLGLELQILDDQTHPDARGERGELRKLGALYDLIAADKNPRFVHGPGEWNHVRIVVRRNGEVEHWLNHQRVVAYDRSTAAFRELVAASKYRDYEGFGRFGKGRLLLQDHGDPVAFRSIKLRELE